MTTACSFQSDDDHLYYCQKLRLNCIRKNQLVIFNTSKGDFVVKLFGEDNPVTVANFIENIENDIYHNQSFYKILKFPQAKLIQSGINLENDDYVKKERNSINFRPSIPLEIKFKKENKTKYKYSIKDPAEYENIENYFQQGALAMVKSEEKSSSSTEFFFVTDKIPELDGRYSIFGKIVKGIDVLEKINKEDIIISIKISN